MHMLEFCVGMGVKQLFKYIDTEILRMELNQITQCFIHEHVLENVVSEMGDIWFNKSR